MFDCPPCVLRTFLTFPYLLGFEIGTPRRTRIVRGLRVAKVRQRRAAANFSDLDAQSVECRSHTRSPCCFLFECACVVQQPCKQIQARSLHQLALLVRRHPPSLTMSSFLFNEPRASCVELMLHLHMTVQPVLPTTQPQPQPQPPAALHPMRISQLGQNYCATTGTD